ncbi:MAG: HAD family hydrolase [Thermodesulfobacteriota bacterium]
MKERDSQKMMMGGLEKRDQRQKVKAVVFDFDGTLAVLNINFQLMRERFFDLINLFGIERELIKERYVLEMINEVYLILLERNPSKAKDFYHRAHQVLKEVELHAAEDGRLIPGVEATLRGLRKKGIKVGIVTRNCGEAVLKVFPNLYDHCDLFISRDSVGRVKPHPDHLNSVMKGLDLSGEETIMVGDHPIDIQAGKKAGMKTVGVLTGKTKREEFERAEADYILRDATEIYQVLEQ